jgi:hypothetical protein
LLERVGDLGPHVLDRTLGVHLYELAARAVVVDDRLGLPVIGRESLLDCVGLVVGAAFELRPLRQPLTGQIVGQLEQQDDRERLVDLLEQRVERLGLRDRARVAVEDEAAVGLQDLVPDERDRDLVGNELALGEERLDLLAELRAARARSPIEVTGRDVRNLVLGRDLLRLRALARPLRSQDEDVQRRNPS